MFGRRSKRAANQVDSAREARAALARTEAVIAHIDAQESEITQLVTSLEHRKALNHFGDSLMIAMQRRVR